MQQISRRNFLQNSTLAAAGMTVGLDRLAEIARFANVKHLSVQLWSIREDMFKDPKGTIEALAKMGFKEVEPFGYDPETSKIFGMHHSEFSTILKNNGLAMPSVHMPFGMKHWDATEKQLTDPAKKAINVLIGMGAKYVIQPYMAEEERLKIADLIPVYQAAANYTKKGGGQFAYHNHDFEFKIMLDGRLLYDWLAQEIDPKSMVLQSDLYWFAKADQDPIDWFKKYPGRFHLCHVKDMAKSEKRETIELGDGSINYTEIFKKRQLAGFKYFVLELEHYKTTPLEGIKKSKDYFTDKLKF